MRGPEVRSLGAAAPSGADAAAETRPPAEALALRGALPARLHGLHGRRARGRHARSAGGRWRCRTARPRMDRAGAAASTLARARARGGRRGEHRPRTERGPGVEVVSPSGGAGSGRASRRRVRARGLVRVRRARVGGGRRRGLRRRVRRLPRAAHGLALVGRASAGRCRRARRGLEPRGRRARRAPPASAPSGWTASPPRCGRSSSRTTSPGSATWLHALERPRGPHRGAFFRSDYLQPFGSFTGELPGGLQLASGYGVMEWHDVHW